MVIGLRAVGLGWVVALTWLSLGCSGGEQLLPVEGTAYVDGRPLKNGSLLFKPDASKGNNGTLEPAAQIGADGKYKLYTTQKPGAPPGWYKVIVIATEPIDPNDLYAPRKSYIHAKYSAEQTTDAALEVVAKPEPGAYDLQLKK